MNIASLVFCTKSNAFTGFYGGAPVSARVVGIYANKHPIVQFDTAPYGQAAINASTGEIIKRLVMA